MALRFIGRCLIDEKTGDVFPVTAEEIIAECLKDSFEDLSHVKIIFHAVETVTGQRVIRSNYNSSELYNLISNAVYKDPRFQSKIKEMRLKEKELRWQEKEEREKRRRTKASQNPKNHIKMYYQKKTNQYE